MPFVAPVRSFLICRSLQVEKVHMVWAPVIGSRKLRSPVYMFCVVTLVLYVGVVVLLFIGAHM